MEDEIFTNPQNNETPPLNEWYEQWQRPQVPEQEPERMPDVPAATKTKKKKEKKVRGWLCVLLSFVLSVILVGAGCLVTSFVLNNVWKERFLIQAQNFNNRIELMQDELDILYRVDSSAVGATIQKEGCLTPGQVYAANMKAVVTVTGKVVQPGFYGYEEYQNYGSGFILSEDGYVVSNYHVVEGAESLSVVTYDDHEYEAKLIGYDANNDIALMKIDGQDLPHVTIGSSDQLVVGDQVAAVGNALGELSSTLTVGYVSAKDRIITTDGTAINMIQTDAAINSGNSGGPLFNMKGEVVGITTAKYSGTSSSGSTIEGIGFAIPIDDVYGMLEDLRVFGYVTGAYLGVVVRDVDEYGQAYGLPAGVYIDEVLPDYAAQEAGAQEGDIILGLGEYEVSCMAELTRALRKFNPGDTTTLTVYRNGQQQELTIVLDEKPQEEPEEVEQQETEAMVPSNYGDEDWEDEFFRYFFGGW